MLFVAPVAPPQKKIRFVWTPVWFGLVESCFASCSLLLQPLQHCLPETPPPHTHCTIHESGSWTLPSLPPHPPYSLPMNRATFALILVSLFCEPKFCVCFSSGYNWRCTVELRAEYARRNGSFSQVADWTWCQCQIYWVSVWIRFWSNQSKVIVWTLIFFGVIISNCFVLFTVWMTLNTRQNVSSLICWMYRCIMVGWPILNLLK